MLQPLERREPERSDPNTVALLSLKLLLLGFFILLNALSQFEEDRARRVLESVNEAFNGQIQSLLSLAPRSVAEGPTGETAALVEVIGDLFQSRIPAVRTETLAKGSRLRLELSAGSIFRPGQETLQPGRELLLRRFAQALAREGQVGAHYDVEIYHGVRAGAFGALGEAGAAALEVRRSSAIVRDLIALGVPSDRLSAGIVPGLPGKVQFVIQVHEGPPRTVDYRELAP